MISDLISKREYIRDYCEILSKEITKEKRNQNRGNNQYQYSTGVTVTYNNNKKGKKGKGKQNKNKGNTKPQVSNHELLGKLGFSDEFIEENRMLGLKERGQTNINFKTFVESPKKRARVFTAHADGRKAGYKAETFDEPDWKETHLTPPARGQIQNSHKLVKIDTLPKWMRGAFTTTEQLNTIQSIVFDSAFNSNNNILVAAPTGAGKTNIALLTIMREVKKYIEVREGKCEPAKIDMTDKPMKIIYLGK